MKRGRKITVPREIRRVATVSSRPQSPVKLLTVSDSINNLDDAISIVLPTAGGQDLSDSFVLSEDFSFLLEIVSPLADSLLIGDQFLLGLGGAVGDSLSLSDTVGVTIELRLEVSDGGSLSDSFNLAQVGHHLVLLTDAQSLDDALAIGHGLLPSDQLVLTDEIAPLMEIFLETSDFTPTMADEAIVIPHGQGLAVERADQLEQLDAIDLFSAEFMSFSDAVVLSDSYSALAAGFISFSDALSQSDAFSIVLGGRLLFADDAANLADGVASAGQIWEYSASDTISQSDAVSISNNTIAQSVSVSDSINNLDDAFSQKMPRWRDSVSLSTINTADIPLTLSDSMNSLSDAVAHAREQFARPTSDISVGLWSTTPLFNKIDESVIDDADLIVSATNPVNDTCEVGLNTATTDPVSSVNHVLSYRYKKSANAGRQIDLTVRLIQGTTILAMFTHTAIGNTITQADQTLTGAQADSITNYGDLRIRFSANNVGTGTGRAGQVTWAQFRCPK